MKLEGKTGEEAQKVIHQEILEKLKQTDMDKLKEKTRLESVSISLEGFYTITLEMGFDIFKS